MKSVLLHIARLTGVFAFGVFLSSAFNYLIVSNSEFADVRGGGAAAIAIEDSGTTELQEAQPASAESHFSAGEDPAELVPYFAQAKAPEPIKREVTATARKGDTLLSFLRRGGIAATEAAEISEALKKEVKAVQIGQRMDVLLERSGENPDMLVFRELKLPYAEKQLQVVREDDGKLSIEAIHKPLAKKLVRAGTAIYGSLMGSAEDLGVPGSVMQSVINAYSYDVDFQREVMAGDRFEVVYESMQDDRGKHIRSGNVLYAQLTLSGRPKRIYYYTDQSGNGAFYTEQGKSVKRALLKTPINGARVSSRYGMRMHPVLGYSKMHKGVDFAAPVGTPIYAAGDGRVVEAGRKGSYGNYVRIRHNSDYSTAYAHISRFAKGIRAGSRVRQGQVIAYVGNTGRSTGAHLHFELLRGKQQVNPSMVKSVSAGALNKRELARFRKTISAMHQTMAQLPMRTQQAALR